MDNGELRIELKKLRVQRWQVAASFLGPLTAVAVLFFTFSGTLAAARQEAESQATQVAADTGEKICVPNQETRDELLTSNILIDLDLDTFCEKYLQRAPSIAVQKELVAQLVQNPNDHSTILAMWRAVYENDDWISGIESAVTGAP